MNINVTTLGIIAGGIYLLKDSIKNLVQIKRTYLTLTGTVIDATTGVVSFVKTMAQDSAIEAGKITLDGTGAYEVAVTTSVVQIAGATEVTLNLKNSEGVVIKSMTAPATVGTHVLDFSEIISLVPGDYSIDIVGLTANSTVDATAITAKFRQV